KVGFMNGKAHYNIKFGAQQEQTYCPWCYDGIKDYDELGIDCGGPSCPSCLRIERPAATYADLKCGDGECQEGNEYACPEECRNLNLTLLLILILIVLLSINIYMWGRAKKKGTLTRTKNIIYGVNSIIIGGLLLYVTINFVCVSPPQCELFMTVLALTGISLLLFLIIFRGVLIWQKTKTFYLYIGMPSETRQIMAEINSLMRKSYKNLEVGDIKAAKILYMSIEPLYETLEDKDKIMIIRKITELYNKIEKRGGR
ncbi:MAG: hypothetical protein QXR60_03455, partial [Candidatus Nanoarchaeia archaeon]